MRWTPWNCAPSPKKSRLAAFRALQAELLEPRLALSHAPPTDYGADPGHDAGSQNAPAYSSSAYGASQSGAQQYGAPQYDSQQHDSQQHDSQQHDSQQYNGAPQYDGGQQHSDGQQSDDAQQPNASQYDSQQYNAGPQYGGGQQYNGGLQSSGGPQYDSGQRPNGGQQYNAAQQPEASQYDSQQYDSQQYDSQQYDSQEYNAGPQYNAGQQYNYAGSQPNSAAQSNNVQPYNAAPQSSNTQQFVSPSSPNTIPESAPTDSAANDNSTACESLPPPTLTDGQSEDVSHLVGTTPVGNFGSTPVISGPGGYAYAPIVSIISSSAPVIVGLGSTVGPIGNPVFSLEEPIQVSVPSFVAPAAASVVHNLGAVSTVAANTVSAALTFGLAAGGQTAAAQSSQAVVLPQNTAVEGPKAIVPGPSALGFLPGDIIYRGPASEPLNVLPIAPLQELPRMDREYLAAPSSNFETSQLVAETRESIGLEVNATATPLAIRGALIAGMAPNFEALDQALEVALDEIEKMGGDLVTWLDESDNMSWAIGGAVVVLAAGGYYWQRRRTAQPAAGNSEELSSWLFTHLYNPTGRP